MYKRFVMTYEVYKELALTGEGTSILIHEK